MKVKVVFNVYWQVKNNEQFKVTKCRKVINCKTQKLLKQTINGGSLGYNINGNFYNIKTFKNFIEPIPKDIYLPF
jgi:hypothetical protein